MTDKKKKKQKSNPPKLESTPIKFWQQEGERGMNAEIKTVEGETKADAFFAQIKAVTGVKDSELAMNILDTAARTIDPFVRENEEYNIIAQSLHDIGPRDATEARLAVQATVLFTHGMKCLRRTETADMMCHSEFYANKAIKLLRLHNETIETLNRYRRGGEQKIVVQHNVVADKAIVNFGEGGGKTKNGGKNPCSEDYAAQKREPMAINHVDSPQCQMEGVDCMEENVRAPKLKKGKDD